MRMRKFSGATLAAASAAALLACVALPSSAQPGVRGGGGANIDELAAMPTPRLANGKPDLTGSWSTISGSYRGAGGGMFRREVDVPVSYGVPVGTHIQLTLRNPEDGAEKTVDLIVGERAEDF